jgi:hypothetical protein
MALVRELQVRTLDKNIRHTEAECTYSIVLDGSERCLQIDTYGSAARKRKSEQNQSVRFSPSALRQLKQIIQSEFPDA